MHTIKRGAKCHDIMDRVGNYWNQNLKLCLKNNGYTQETFAKAYKKQYGTGNQADVYRWLNVGNMSGSSGKRIGLPSYDTMKRIADFFHVTVGYLTGETDYETFEMERACKYFGVSEETGKVLKKQQAPLTTVLNMAINLIITNALLMLFLHQRDFPNSSMI